MRALVFLSTFLILTSSCDPAYDIDYTIDNDTDHSLTISWKYRDYIETNYIAGQTKLTIYNHFGLGDDTKGVMEKTNFLPFTELNIKNKNGKTVNKDLLDINNWVKNYPRKNDNTGSIVLYLEENDFE